MIWFLIFIPLLIGLFFKEMVLGAHDWLEGIMGFLFSIFEGCLFGALLSAMIAVPLGFMFDMHYVQTSSRNLVALRDKDGIEDNFFLGSGHIGSQPYYFYYTQQSDGGYSPSEIKADDSVTVYETTEKSARLISYEVVANSRIADWVSLPLSEGDHLYKFYVPAGTIKRGFSL
jgi:hypothetical protein